jgi:hypothetical protein
VGSQRTSRRASTSKFHIALEAAKAEARYSAETRVFDAMPFHWLKNGYPRDDWRQSNQVVREVVDEVMRQVHTEQYMAFLAAGDLLDKPTEPMPPRFASEDDTEAAAAEDLPPPATVRIPHIPPHHLPQHVCALVGNKTAKVGGGQPERSHGGSDLVDHRPYRGIQSCETSPLTLVARARVCPRPTKPTFRTAVVLGAVRRS